MTPDEPWSLDLLRRMTRAQFNARVKHGDVPPADITTEFLRERLERAADRSRQ